MRKMGAPSQYCLEERAIRSDVRSRGFDPPAHVRWRWILSGAPTAEKAAC